MLREFIGSPRGGRLRAASSLVEPDGLLGGVDAFARGALLRAGRCRLLRFALTLRRGLLQFRFGVRAALGRVAISLDLLLALLPVDFVLQAPALDLGLGLVSLQSRFGISLLCIRVAALRARLSIGLRLLQAAFTGQITVSD
jgi:hypothetical protein